MYFITDTCIETTTTSIPTIQTNNQLLFLNSDVFRLNVLFLKSSVEDFFVCGEGLKDISRLNLCSFNITGPVIVLKRILKFKDLI